MSFVVSRGIRLAIVGVVALFGSVAGAVADSDVYDVVAKPTLDPGMPIPEPSGQVVLRINGRFDAAPNGTNEIVFDLPTLERIGLIRYTTPTNWTDGPTTFEGVLLSRLLDVVAAEPQATTLVLTALNEYSVSVPIADARNWPVMLALQENGEYMSRREHGPLWVIYPQHAYPELGGRQFLARWVWQLAKISIQ